MSHFRYILFLSSICCLSSFCARNPSIPKHATKLATASLGSSACDTSSMQLSEATGTGTKKGIELIQPVALSALTISDVSVGAEHPFQGLGLVFLNLSGKVNDSQGGFVRFSIQSGADSKTLMKEDVPSGVLRWVPNLNEGQYKVTAMPCNSLGCRDDLAVTNLYAQPANNDPSLASFQSSFNECYTLLQKLYDSGETMVAQAQSITKYLSLANGQGSTNSSCTQEATQDGLNDMLNIQRLGAAYLGEINAHPETMQPLYMNLAAIPSNNGSNSSTSTNTSTQSSTTASSTVAKWTLFGLGITSIVGGMFATIISASKLSSTWANISIPDRAPLDAPVTTKGESVETSPLKVGKTGIKTSVAGMSAGLFFLGAGLISTIASQFLLSAGTATDTASNTHEPNPLDQAATYMNDTLIPLQNQFRQCTVNLSQKIPH